MRILAIADEEYKGLWDYFTPEKLEGVDLILAAGDLKSSYLSFLVTMGKVPILYVHGNHDLHYKDKPPEGCDCIEDQIYNYGGVRILGLGGSMLYNGSGYQYSEREMDMRVARLSLSLLKNRGFDILLTHAPAAGFHDDTDLCHRGFQVFNTLIDHYKPACHVHGHIHQAYGSCFARDSLHGETRVINACGYYIFDLDLPNFKKPAMTSSGNHFKKNKRFEDRGFGHRFD